MLRALLKQPAAVVAATVDARLTADVLHTGKTALMLAAFKHFTQGVKLLLEEGGACVRGVVGWLICLWWGIYGGVGRCVVFCVPYAKPHPTKPHPTIKPYHHHPGANPYVTDNHLPPTPNTQNTHIPPPHPTPTTELNHAPPKQNYQPHPGANPYVTDDRGRTALDLVCFLGRNDKVRAMEGMLLVRASRRGGGGVLSLLHGGDGVGG